MVRKALLAMVVLSLISSVATATIAYAKSSQGEKSMGGLFGGFFHSYIDIEVDEESLQRLNEPIPLESTVSINVKIIYWHDIPDFWAARRWLLFHTPTPQQRIHIEVVNITGGAINARPLIGDLNVDVPEKGGRENGKTVTATISITPLRDARCQPTYLTIVASCEDFGVLRGARKEITIPFTPGFIASVSVDAPGSVTVSPHETKDIVIKVRNVCNRNVKVLAEPVGEARERWGASVQPSFMEIPAGETGVFRLSIIGPYELGWHEEISTLRIKFTVTPQPEIGGTEPYIFYSDFTAQNVGFYMPLPLIVAIVVVLAIIGVAVFYISKFRKGS